MTYSMILYIIIAIITAIMTLIWWAFRRWAIQIDKKFDLLIQSVQKLDVKNAKKDEQIVQIIDQQNTQDSRLNDHSKRIRTIEIDHGNE